MSEKITRHSIAVRLIHWSVAISGLFLLFSGFGQLPMYKRYNIIKIPGLGWASNFETNFVMHLVAAIIFATAVLFHMVFHYRKNEFSILPKKGDFKESVQIIKAMFTKSEEPPSDKFLAEQRLAYAGIGIFSLLLIFTGLIKSLKNMGAIVIPPAHLQFFTLIHTAGAMIFMLLIIFHVGAFLIKSNRPLLPSMFTGRVKKHYADERHSKWDYEKEQ